MRIGQETPNSNSGESLLTVPIPFSFVLGEKCERTDLGFAFLALGNTFIEVKLQFVEFKE